MSNFLYYKLRISSVFSERVFSIRKAPRDPSRVPEQVVSTLSISAPPIRKLRHQDLYKNIRLELGYNLG
jgi:hypothetical protein